MIATHVAVDIQPRDRVAQRPLSQAQLANVFRNLAVIYYVLGDTGDAVCYSRLALDHGINLYETVQHERLLLSLGKVDQALPILRHGIAVGQENASPELLVDYSLAMYSLGDAKLAEESAGRALSRPQIGYLERRTAKVLQLLIASKRSSAVQSNGDSGEGFSEALDLLFEDDPKLCAEFDRINTEYWPEDVFSDVDTFLTSICDGRKQSSA